MRTIFRLPVVLACLVAALLSYAFGVESGAIVFFILGIAFEGLFWMGLFGRKRVK